MKTAEGRLSDVTSPGTCSSASPRKPRLAWSPADEARQSSASPRSISPEKTALRSPRLMWQVPSKSSAGPLPPAQPDGLSPRWNGREIQSFQPHSLLRERDLTPRRTPRGVVFPQPVVSQSGFGLARGIQRCPATPRCRRCCFARSRLRQRTGASLRWPCQGDLPSSTLRRAACGPAP
ncbi:unnamed protein product [Effrenium voratum]|nr:unnamed protein product [Effrenium voratum]